MSTCTFVFIIFSIGLSEAVVKYWLPSLDFIKPDFWNDKKPPCSLSHVDLSDMPPVVFLQNKTTVVELILPMNGELSLGPNSEIAFNVANEDMGDNCNRPVVHFDRVEPDNWFNPDNWCTAESEDEPCTDTSGNILDYEQVPCQYDTVVFPKDGAYYINLDTYDDIKLGRVKIQGEYYYKTEDFEKYLQSPDGKKQFTSKRRRKDIPRVLLENPCDDVVGCPCRTENDKVTRKICSIKRPDCGPVSCKTPIRPYGACCNLCGALLKVTHSMGFSTDNLRHIIKKRFLYPELTGNVTVNLAISKVPQQQYVQLVLADRHGGHWSQITARKIQDFLDSDRVGQNTYSTTGIEIVTSGKPYEPTHAASTQSRKLGRGAVIGIVLTLIIICALLAVASYVVWRRRSGLIQFEFNFLKKKDSGDMELQNPSAAFVDVTMGTPDAAPDINVNVLRGFDNPMYDTPINQDFFQDPSSSPNDPSIKINPVYCAEDVDNDTDDIIL